MKIVRALPILLFLTLWIGGCSCLMVGGNPQGGRVEGCLFRW
jgi:hypothetical protein